MFHGGTAAAGAGTRRGRARPYAWTRLGLAGQCQRCQSSRSDNVGAARRRASCQIASVVRVAARYRWCARAASGSRSSGSAAAWSRSQRGVAAIPWEDGGRRPSQVGIGSKHRRRRRRRRREKVTFRSRAAHGRRLFASSPRSVRPRESLPEARARASIGSPVAVRRARANSSASARARRPLAPRRFADPLGFIGDVRTASAPSRK